MASFPSLWENRCARTVRVQVQPDRAVTHIDLVLNWLGEVERAAAKR
jgi:hypothetical protein